jgi:hypothetical protein
MRLEIHLSDAVSRDVFSCLHFLVRYSQPSPRPKALPRTLFRSTAGRGAGCRRRVVCGLAPFAPRPPHLFI